MTFVHEIEIPNDEYKTLTRERAIQKDNLETFAIRRDHANAMLRDIDSILEWEGIQHFVHNMVQRLGQNFPDNSYGPTLATTLENFHETMTSEINYKKNQYLQIVETNREKIERTQRRIAELNESIENEDPNPRRVTLKDVNRCLAGVDHVVPGSAVLYDTCVSWVYSSLFANVINTKAKYPFFHGDVRIPIGRTTVTIDLQSHRIGIHGSQADRIYMWEGNANVHPHVLGGDKPCLGDFGGPLMEAIAEEDWGSTAALLGLFLSTIDDTDSAGANWIRHMTRKFGSDVSPRFSPEPNDYKSIWQTNGFPHYFFEGNAVTARRSKLPLEFIPFEDTEVQSVEPVQPVSKITLRTIILDDPSNFDLPPPDQATATQRYAEMRENLARTTPGPPHPLTYQRRPYE